MPTPKQYPLNEGEYLMCLAHVETQITNPIAPASELNKYVNDAVDDLRKRRGVVRLPRGATQLRLRLKKAAIEIRDGIHCGSAYERVMRIARTHHPSCSNWFRTRSTGTTRVYVCNVCNVDIDSESAKYQQTKHVKRALDVHYEEHAAQATNNAQT